MEVILVRVIDVIAEVFFWAVFARVLMSWVRVDPYHPIIRLLHDFTEPVLMPIRNVMPKAGNFDFSPIIALMLVRVAARVIAGVVRLLFCSLSLLNGTLFGLAPQFTGI